jgi:Uma2 family endonuclease
LDQKGTISESPSSVALRLREELESMTEMPVFSANDRVRISRDFFWAKNATGTISEPPAEVVGLSAGARLLEWAEEHGGHCVSSNGGFTLPDGAVRSPDACWVSIARIAQLTEAQKKGFAPVCPEFLIEIISESDSRATLEAKMEMWIANGALLAWMIDPFAADIVIYEPGQAPRHVVRPDWVEAETVVPGFRLETSRLWAK